MTEREDAGLSPEREATMREYVRKNHGTGPDHVHWLLAVVLRLDAALTTERTRREAAEATAADHQRHLVETIHRANAAMDVLRGAHEAEVAALRERAEKAEAALAQPYTLNTRLATAEREREMAQAAHEQTMLMYRAAERERDEARKEAEDAAAEMERAVDIAEKAHASRDAALAALADVVTYCDRKIDDYHRECRACGRHTNASDFGYRKLTSADLLHEDGCPVPAIIAPAALGAKVIADAEERGAAWMSAHEAGHSVVDPIDIQHAREVCKAAGGAR